MTMEKTDLGMGHAEVIVRITRPDQSVDELTIHRMNLADGIDDVATLGLETLYADRPIGKTSDLAPPTRYRMDLHVCGELLQVEGVDHLYRIEHKP